MDNFEKVEQVSNLLFPDETELNKTPSQKFDDEIRQRIFEMRNQRLAAVDSSYQTMIMILLKIKQEEYWAKNILSKVVRIF